MAVRIIPYSVYDVSAVEDWLEKMSRKGLHFKKFTGNLHIILLHLTDIIKILLNKSENRYIINIQFMFVNQMKQEIKRTFKCLKLV